MEGTSTTHLVLVHGKGASDAVRRAEAVVVESKAERAARRVVRRLAWHAALHHCIWHGRGTCLHHLRQWMLLMLLRLLWVVRLLRLLVNVLLKGSVGILALLWRPRLHLAKQRTERLNATLSLCSRYHLHEKGQHGGVKAVGWRWCRLLAWHLSWRVEGTRRLNEGLQSVVLLQHRSLPHWILTDCLTTPSTKHARHGRRRRPILTWTRSHSHVVASGRSSRLSPCNRRLSISGRTLTRQLGSLHVTEQCQAGTLQVYALSGKLALGSLDGFDGPCWLTKRVWLDVWIVWKRC